MSRTLALMCPNVVLSRCANRILARLSLPAGVRASLRLYTEMKWPDADSLDYLVRPPQHRLRDRQAEGLGGLEVDHQLELGGPLDRKASRLRPLEDAIDGARRAPGHVREACTVGHEAAVLDVFSELEHGGKTVARSQVDDDTPVCVEEGAWEYVDGLRPPPARSPGGTLQVGPPSELQKPLFVSGLHS